MLDILVAAFLTVALFGLIYMVYMLIREDRIRMKKRRKV